MSTRTEQFVEASDELKGKRAACVAGIIEQLVEAGVDEPVPYKTLLEEVGMEDQPAQMQPALHALELTGIVQRYKFTESGSTRSQTAYALTENGEVID